MDRTYKQLLLFVLFMVGLGMLFAAATRAPEINDDDGWLSPEMMAIAGKMQVPVADNR